MPVFNITTPDGAQFRITAPEGGTQEQALAMAKAEYYKRQLDEFTPRDPTENMSGTQKFFAGMGKSIYDTGRGIGNLVGLVSDEQRDAAKELDAPLMDTGAGIAGNIAGHVGQVLAPGGLLLTAGKAANIPKAVNLGREIMAPTSFGSGAAMGAGYNFLQPGTMQERLAGAGLGGAFGGVGGYVGGKLGLPRPEPSASTRTAVSTNPTARVTGGGYNYGNVGPDQPPGLTAGIQTPLQRGEKLGFRATPGQASGSRALQQLEAKLESQPMTSGPFNAIKETNQTNLNKIAANAIGETSEALDEATLSQAASRIGEVYNDVADEALRTIDPDDFLSVVGSIEDEFEGLLPKMIDEVPLVKKLIQYAEKGTATGRQLQSTASKLGKLAYKNMSTQAGDRDLGMALYRVKDYADDLLAQGLDGERLAAFTQARDQYRNLMLLTQRRGVLNAGSGNVQGSSLAGLLQQKDRRGYLYGENQSDLYNAARFSQAFRPLFGDSGTATRSPLPTATDVMLSAPTNLAVESYLRFPRTTAYGGNAIGRSAPITGLLTGGAIGREMY